MNQVITGEQVRQVTRRSSVLPVLYEEAVLALQACLTLDEAKHWGNKADALEAWAKIYRDGATLRKAKCLKLHAYRRMGELAAEIGPAGTLQRAPKGTSALLRSHGFSQSQAQVMRTLARMPQAKFHSEMQATNPRSPSKFAHQAQYLNPAWQDVYHRLQAARWMMRKHPAVALAISLSGQSTETARALICEMSEWLDAFDQALPKGGGSAP